MSTKQNDETQSRWYMVNKDGMAALCADQADAEQAAVEAQDVWPHMGPHRAVRLVEVGDAGFTAADMATAEARGFRDGQAEELAAMRAGGEPVAEMVPCYTPSGKRVAVISRFQHLPIGTKLYTHPQPAAPAQSGVRQFTDDERQFTKKPVTIQAIQWTGRNLREVIAFTDGPPDTRSAHAGMAWDAYVDLVARDGLKIYTLEGKMSAAVGDWIIKGVQGEHYPCKPDIFEATYSRAALAAPAQQPWQYTPPAQERIDALELEVRQLTEQIAELRGGAAYSLPEWLEVMHASEIRGIWNDCKRDGLHYVAFAWRIERLGWQRLLDALRSSHGKAPAQQPAPSAAPACTRSHPHENMTWRCQVLSVLAEMHNMEARGQGATEHDLVRFADRLEAALLGSPSAAPAMGSQRFCYSCGHPDDAHPWVENPRGGKRRGNCPENPTPQADSQPAPLREGEWINDAGRIKWLMWRVQDLEAKLAARAPADSVLEDAARLERERICAAIKAEDDYCVEHGDYMLDSDDCIKIVRGEWVRPDYLVDAARKQGGA